MGMMRLTMAVWWSLALFWLLTHNLDAQPGQGHAAPSSSSAAAASWPREIIGRGLTLEGAKNDAVRHVIEKTVAFLREQEPPMLAWQPTPDFVQERMIDGPGRADKDLVLPDVGTTKTWILTVKPLDLAMLRALDEEAQRGLRAGQRLALSGQLLGALLAVLATFLGYLHLDERTQGRYRRWLRAGAVAMLMVGGAGWWWLQS